MFLKHNFLQEVAWTKQFMQFHSCPLCHSTQLASTLESEYLGHEHEEVVQAYFCTSCGYWELLAQEWGQEDYKEDEKYFESRLKNFNELPTFFESISEIVKNIKTKDDFHDMSPRQFEEFTYFYTKDFLECDVVMTKQTKDGGYDLIGLDTEKGPIIIEAKKYKSKRIDVSIIRQMAGVQLINNIPNSIIVTTGKITKDAIREKQKLNHLTNYQLDIHDIEDLMSWLNLIRNDIVKIEIRSILDNIGFLENTPVSYMVCDRKENTFQFVGC